MSSAQKDNNRLIYKYMKKNIHFRRIPDYINQELSRIQSQHVVVAAIINTTKDTIARGDFRHAGISMDDGKILIQDILTPDMINGIYARRNRNGIIWVLKDLPKVNKTLWWESPNFGDPDRGYHSNYRDIKVYQRRLDPPREWEISISILSEDESKVKIKAEILTVLDKMDASFEEDLFFAINLMQEQFHDCHIFDSKMTNEEITRVTTVGWEIFPAGTMERAVAVVLGRIRNTSQARQKEIQDRATVINSLTPSEFIVGSGMNSRYFGAKFGEDLVVFENADYGNAIYILFDNWEEISQMSRIDILKRHEKDFIRIVHKSGWEKVLRHHINELKGGNNGN